MSNYTEDDLKALQKALVSGARRVTYGGNTVEFYSPEELKSAISIVQSALNGRKKIRRTLLRTGGGN